MKITAHGARAMAVAASIALVGSAASQDLPISTQSGSEVQADPAFRDYMEAVMDGANERANLIHQEKCSPKPPARQKLTYPQELIGTDIHGTTVLLLEINPCGEVREVSFEKSSRNRILDSAARNVAMSWVYEPERLGLAPGRGGRFRIAVEFHPPAPAFPIP